MIRLKNVQKAFGKKVVASNLNIEIEKGETHVIIGRSGEGKSVMLKLVSALMAPDQGEIWVAGRKVDINDKESVAHVRHNVSMVFQMAALFDSMTVRENVGFYLDERHDMPPGEIDRITAQLLREVNLPDAAPLLPSELSGGMRKRVGLARALAAQPAILLYDEPTTGLDPVTSDIINDLILSTRQRHGVTAIVVTHDMQSAYKVGDRISMLYEGTIIFTGTPDEIRNTPNPIVHQFVNGLADGPITRRDDDNLQVRASKVIQRITGVKIRPQL